MAGGRAGVVAVAVAVAAGDRAGAEAEGRVPAPVTVRGLPGRGTNLVEEALNRRAA
jgi:hypothetical protein